MKPINIYANFCIEWKNTWKGYIDQSGYRKSKMQINQKNMSFLLVKSCFGKFVENVKMVK